MNHSEVNLNLFTVQPQQGSHNFMSLVQFLSLRDQPCKLLSIHKKVVDLIRHKSCTAGLTTLRYLLLCFGFNWFVLD